MPIFDRLGRLTILFFAHLYRFFALVLNTIRAVVHLPTYIHLISAQMMSIGVRSLPIVVFTAAFMGMVTSVQAVYQFQSYVPLYLVGSVVTESVVLELGPVLTALVLSGRVGANIAAELGNVKCANMVMIGAYMKKTGAVDLDVIKESIGKVYVRANEAILKMNSDAIDRGAALIK